jgi:hypothetical protein
MHQMAAALFIGLLLAWVMWELGWGGGKHIIENGRRNALSWRDFW